MERQLGKAKQRRLGMTQIRKKANNRKGVEHRLPTGIDQFFELVAEWLATKEAATGDGHAWIGSSRVQGAGACAGEGPMHEGAA